MRAIKRRNITILVFSFLFVFAVSNIQSQTYKLNNATSSVSVLGTSSLHDWEVVAETISGNLVVETTNGLEIKNLNVSVESESLKSGKGAMDKNTYKALKTDKHKTITFKLTEVKNVTEVSSNNYKIKALGDLTIAGTKKAITLDFNVQVNDQTVTLLGEKQFNMTTFSIQPPKALFGTITTGDQVTIKFKTLFKQ